MKEILKLGGILFLIAAICSGLVGFVSEITKEPIALQEKETRENAMQEVLAEAQEFEEVESTEEGGPVYAGIKDGQIIGYAISVAPNGYDGPIQMIVGVTAEGAIGGVIILDHGETPGLGANATDPSFTDQFKGKSAMISTIKSGTPKEDEISAITGATITSDAVAEGVNRALEHASSQEGLTQ